VGTRSPTLDNWKIIVWSYGSRLLLSHADGRVRIWRKQHESMDPSCLVQAGGSGVLVWGMFSCHMLGSLDINWATNVLTFCRIHAPKNSGCSGGKGGSVLYLINWLVSVWHTYTHTHIYTVPVKSLDRSTHSRVFLYLSYFILSSVYHPYLVTTQRIGSNTLRKEIPEINV
jgi:hypothetical protein